MVAQIGQPAGAKPSVGQFASDMVRMHLDALKNARAAAAAPDAAKQDLDQAVSRNILQQMIDEQISPLRERVKRLERELHGVGAGNRRA